MDLFQQSLWRTWCTTRGWTHRQNNLIRRWSPDYDIMWRNISETGTFASRLWRMRITPRYIALRRRLLVCLCQDIILFQLHSMPLRQYQLTQERSRPCPHYKHNCYTSWSQCHKTPTSRWNKCNGVTKATTTRGFVRRHKLQSWYTPDSMLAMIAHHWNPLEQSD